MGVLKSENFSYTYSLVKGNYCMESKIIEYWITLLHKYKVEQNIVTRNGKIVWKHGPNWPFTHLC